MRGVPVGYELSHTAGQFYFSVVFPFMKRTHPPEENAKFSGNLRHYHRTGAQTPRSWDDWVEGTTTKTIGSKSWLKIFGVIGGALALTAIIIGLIIELS